MTNKKNEQHLSAAELAGMPGLPGTKRGVNHRATVDAWLWRKRRGSGGGREYPISCLPVETQTALAEKVLSDAPAARSSSIAAGAPFSSTRGVLEAPALTTPESGVSPDPRSDRSGDYLAAIFEAKPEKQKQEAKARLAIVNEYVRLQRFGFDRARIIDAITTERSISEATLSRYLSLVRGKPEHLWLAVLCPSYAGRTAKAEMSAEAWETLKADYLRAERPSASTCIDRLKRAAKKRGWTIPSERTLLRRLDSLPRQVKVLAREGRQAALQLYPSQQRSRAALQALSIVNSDGYLHNLFVLFPDGEIRRPKTQFWQDVHSSKILGFRTDKTEHTDGIRLSFGDLVERYGIPDAVLLDNTLAAANKTMSGGIKHRFRFKVRDEEPLGVFPLLNVKVMWATPGHGQAKPIERAFGIGGIGEIVDKHPELAGAWTGGNTLDKPEYDGKTKAVPLSLLEAIIEQEVAAYNAKTGRRSPVHQGRSFDEVFNESYAGASIRRAAEAQRRLWLLAAEVRTATRDGSISLEAGRITRSGIAPTQANRYWHPDLIDHAGRQLVARFDPRRLHEGLHVYSLDGRYIAYAECHAPQGFNDQVAARELQRNRKTFMRSTKDALHAERRMDAIEASKFLPGAEERSSGPASIPAPKVIRAEFRDPIERPRVKPTPQSAEEASEMEQLERDLASPAPVNVLELQSDADKHTHWQTLNARREGGEQLADQEEQFWAAWQQSEYFVIEKEMTAEFEEQHRAAG